MNNQFCNSNKVLNSTSVNNSLQTRGEKNKKIDFVQKKENTISSLFEVEHFLCNFQKIAKSIKLYNILKK